MPVDCARACAERTGFMEKLVIAERKQPLWRHGRLSIGGKNPCISGTGGSGTVFLSGCTLRCVFCQNREIAAGHSGREISLDRLAEIFLELQEKRRAQYQSGHADTLFRLSRGSSEESQGERADDSGHIQYERL